ncbi:MAG: 30S ribosomal protein S3 [Nitrosopumilaceae archaeon]
MSAVKNVIKDNYNMMLLNDYLRVKIKDAGYSGVDISKTPTGTRIALHVTRPGIVIGRKGTGIRELTETLAKNFGLKNPQLSVVEIDKPELSASVMCNRLASHIERGTAFRRATMWTLKQIMENGAMGVQITCSGKLRGDRSSFEKHTSGILPRAGHHAEVIVNEDIVHVKTPMGLIGIRIRIARKDRVVPEFELKDKAKIKQMVVPQVEEKEEEEEEKEIIITEEVAEAIVAKEIEQKKPRTETEQILLEAEQMKNLETLEEVEEKLK